MKYEIDSIIFSDIDNCDPNPCVNGGVCTDGINSYTCTCAEGYTGENCVESRFYHFNYIERYILSFKINQFSSKF